MPRLNIYLNDEVHKLALQWREHVSLSDICSRAIRDELEAIDTAKDIKTLSQYWRSCSKEEDTLKLKYGLKDAVVTAPTQGQDPIRAVLGKAAAKYVNSIVANGIELGICGGRQMWEVVRNLEPRNARVNITAYGVEPTSSNLYHVHANALAVILSLLYQPRASAAIVHKSSDTASADPAFGERQPALFLSSCADYDERLDFYQEISVSFEGKRQSTSVLGEYGYCFFDHSGAEVPARTPYISRIPPHNELKKVADNEGNSVILVGGGEDKQKTIQLALLSGYCNTLITDYDTYSYLAS